MMDLLLLLFFWPLVCAVCPNHEVLMLQPRTGTAPDLVYVSIITTFIIVYYRPTCFKRFLDIFMFYFTILPPLHQSPFVIVAFLSVETAFNPPTLQE